MLAMVLEEHGKPLELKDIPVPSPEADEVLVRMRACGVCGTDLKIAAGGVAGGRVPMIMGHEPMGEVAQIYGDGHGLELGDRVIVSTYLPCGSCKFCAVGRNTLCLNLRAHIGFDRNGGFAEFITVPAADLVKVPDTVSDEGAAILSCAVGTVYHALRARAGVKVGDTVLVMGVGGLGVHAVQVARLAGANVIAVDIAEERLSMAREYGADEVVLFRESDFVDQVRRLTGGGVTIAVETVGQPRTIEAGLSVLEPGGKLIITGYLPGKPFTALPSAFVVDELEILGTRAVTKQELTDLVELVAKGRIKPVVTHRYPLAEVNTALDDLAKGRILGRGVIVL